MAALLIASGSAGAQTFSVTSNADTGAVGTLRWAVGQANSFAGAATINFNAGLGTITLVGELPILENAAGITINGNGNTIDGGSTSNTTGFRVFFLGVSTGETAGSSLTATTNTAWSIGNLTIQNANARGGNGADAGGGGAGLGGGIFVNAGALSLSGVTFSNDRAIGGNGSGFTSGFAGGGGGMGGNGGTGANGSGSNGGGGLGIGANGGTGTAGLYVGAAAGGNSGGSGGGGGGLATIFGGGGGGGGVSGGNGSGSGYSSRGGGGGFGGGGGGGNRGGGGGYGGGGGGGWEFALSNVAGAGGFGGGGGGGGGSPSSAGGGGFGGGAGTGGASGGGLGAGGAIFIRQGASVNLIDGGLANGAVQGGAGANAGQGLGSGLFLAGGATYTVTGSNTVTIGDTLGGGANALITGGFAKNGTGTLVLTGNNSFTGGLAMNGGALSVGADNHLGAAANGLAFNGGTLQVTGNTFTATLRTITWGANGGGFDIAAAANIFTVAQTLAGGGALAKSGAGTLALTGANTFTGSTTVTGGTLAIQSLATGSNNPNLPGGNVFTTSAINVSANAVAQVDLGATSLASTNAGLTLSGAGTVRKSGAGTWWLGNPGGGTVIAMSAGGLIDVQGGVLRNDFANANWSGNAAILNVANGATVDLRNNAITVGAITGAGTLDNTFTTAQTLTTGAGNGSGTFSGSFTETAAVISLTKTGTGTQTLSGSGVNYTGATTASGGKLVLFNATAFHSPTTIASGATLAWSGNGGYVNGSTAATIALNSGGTLENLNAANYMVINGAVTNTGATTINNTVNATASGDRGFYLDGGLHGTGTVTINAPTAGSGVNFRNNNSTFSGTIVVNGIASAVPFSGSGIGMGGNATSFSNADITLNGTMEMLNAGLGWANGFPGDFAMGALNGSGVMVANFNGLNGQTRVKIGSTNNHGTFSGTIADGINDQLVLTKLGTGTQTLSGASTFTGGTTVSGGVLLAKNVSGSATGSGPVSVAGGTLGGTGTVAGTVSISTGGTLAPGASIGTLNTGSLVFDENTARYRIEIDLTGGLADRTNVTGSVDLDGPSGTVVPQLEFIFLNGVPLLPTPELFTIIDNDGTGDATQGIFANYLEGSAFDLGGGLFASVNYHGGDGNDVVVMFVPEPSTASLLAMTAAGLLGRRKRARTFPKKSPAH